MGTKITIELPDELHAAVSGAGLDSTTICRVALEESLEHAARAIKFVYSPEKFQRNPELKELCSDPRFPD